MRTKFRAWNVKEGSMFLDEDFSVSNNGKILFFENGDSFDIPTEYEINQWTGLLDKNGKEIYEGDIIRIPQKTNWVVEWIDSGYRYWSYNKENGFKLSEKTKCEIIGNVYENQDLIK